MQARLLLALPWLLVACGSTTTSPVDIGDMDSPPEKQPTSLVGTWRGYAEAHQFADGTDRIQLTLDADQRGTFAVGEAAWTWTPNATHPPHLYGNLSPRAPANPETDGLGVGFAYTLRFVRLEGSRLRFNIQSSEPYVPWCALQTPVPADPVNLPNVYACFASSGSFQEDETGCWITTEDGQKAQEIDCDVLVLGLCAPGHGDCSCDADHCSTPVPDASDAPALPLLDATFGANGNELQGTFVIDAQRFNVRFTRL